MPTAVLRYAQRTREPLVVSDATRDDRFAKDPYFTDLTCCSLLALPILSRNTLRALLLLENRLIGDAFTTQRLDAVKLIAGQLAVSLDNAQLYAQLTRSRARIVATADQTRRQIQRDLHDGAQQRLVSIAFKLRTAQAAIPAGADKLAAQLNDLTVEVIGAMEELRELARGIHPAILTKGGLRPALRVGGADFARGTGLVGLGDRVEALGGRLFLNSPHGAGTNLHVELPLTATNGGVTSH